MMLTGNNGILQRATDAKQTTERVEAKEQAQIDIMDWITDKTANHQDASLDDSKIKDILTDKSYVKEAKQSSFITAKGDYEILYSELYTTSDKNKTIKFYLQESGETSDPIEVEVEKGTTWSEWAEAESKDITDVLSATSDVKRIAKSITYRAQLYDEGMLKRRGYAHSFGFMNFDIVITSRNLSVSWDNQSEISRDDSIESNKTYYFYLKVYPNGN